MKQKQSKRKFKGIITPFAWMNGNVIEISINTNDEEEYIVEHNETGKELFSYIHYPVEVSGIIKKRVSDGKMIISVDKCVMVISANNDL